LSVNATGGALGSVKTSSASPRPPTLLAIGRFRETRAPGAFSKLREINSPRRFSGIKAVVQRIASRPPGRSGARGIGWETADMESNSPARDFLLPRLTALVNEVEASGLAREVAVAVLIDLVTSPGFDTAAPDPKADPEPLNL
jgi:hypothetical protein